MTQTRFYFSAARAEAERAFALIEAAFEDEYWPVAIQEIDEDRDIHEVSVYAEPDDADEAGRRLAVLLSASFPALAAIREVLPDVDWVQKSLDGLQPVMTSRFFVHGSHDRQKPRLGRIGIEIDAGMAFGTGHHGTTAGCLDMLGDVLAAEKPRNALDLGAGSAVLAIAIAKLARIPVLATDIDPVATIVASGNIRLNQVSAFVHARTATGFNDPVFGRDGPFELIVANILARPLMKLAPHMARHLAPGGTLVLSGILDRQRNAVVAAYAGQKFRHIRTESRQGWVTIRLGR